MKRHNIEIYREFSICYKGQMFFIGKEEGGGRFIRSELTGEEIAGIKHHTCLSEADQVFRFNREASEQIDWVWVVLVYLGVVKQRSFADKYTTRDSIINNVRFSYGEDFNYQAALPLVPHGHRENINGFLKSYAT